jgi:hypothetical protein
MKWVLLLFLILFSLGAGFYFLYPREYAELQNPVVELGKNITPGVAGDATEVESSLPVSCVLSYGTFFVNQNECDQLNSFDTGERNDTPISCQVSAGTFLVSTDECGILKNAKGSRDIMEQKLE